MALDDGDLHAYDALCMKYADALNAQPALVAGAHTRPLFSPRLALSVE